MLSLADVLFQHKREWEKEAREPSLKDSHTRVDPNKRCILFKRETYRMRRLIFTLVFVSKGRPFDFIFFFSVLGGPPWKAYAAPEAITTTEVSGEGENKKLVG